MSQIDKAAESNFNLTDHAAHSASEAFETYRKSSLQKRAELLRRIAILLKETEKELISVASRETHLSPARLKTELDRTIFQLNSYADHCVGGQWLEARIDRPDKDHHARMDLRKTMIPLGPVVVFGASNFPFAYSTPGGDTASALAAGCPVIIKAHPAHPATSEYCASLISRAVKDCGLPAGVFNHVSGDPIETGELLVKHPLVKAVGFTGSYSGGKQLFDWANRRKEPIPVFAEMGSVNPVFVFPGKIKDNEEEFAGQFAESITQSAGQFCTKPGIIAGIDCSGFRLFANKLAEKINQINSSPMLHPGIHENFLKRKSVVMDQPQISLLAVGRDIQSEGEATPTLLETDASFFLNNHYLHEEVFGPLSMIVYCKDADELHAMVKSFEGQLTATIIATPGELKDHEGVVESAKQIAGRIILNGVPTGVKVCLAMHHGGPFPATTNSHFTSVGGDAIKRFARPVAFQNWPDEFLPPELQNSNPLNIWRTVNNELTREPIR